MKYVGFGALAIGYWANVVLLHLVLTGGCPGDQSVAPPTPVAAAPAPAVAAPVVRQGSNGLGFHCGIRRLGGEVDPFGGSEFGPMSKAALVAGLNAVRPKIHECYVRYQVPGTAMVNVVIAKSGKVAKATVTGKFADTPTGACVERAVKTAAFPPSDGISTPYPFQLK